MTLLTTLSCR